MRFMLRLVVAVEGRNVVLSQKVANVDENALQSVILAVNDFATLFNADMITEILVEQYRIICVAKEKRNIFLVFDRDDSRKDIEKQIEKLDLLK